jgi:hypothetical protein
MSSRTTRELAYRENDGVEISLLWPVGEPWVLVRVADARLGKSFELSVEGGKALDAFYHPYAYAAHH